VITRPGSIGSSGIGGGVVSKSIGIANPPTKIPPNINVINSFLCFYVNY